LRLGVVERSPHYAPSLNAGTLTSFASNNQLPAGCGFSQSLLIKPLGIRPS